MVQTQYLNQHCCSFRRAQNVFHIFAAHSAHRLLQSLDIYSPYISHHIICINMRPACADNARHSRRHRRRCRSAHTSASVNNRSGPIIERRTPQRSVYDCQPGRGCARSDAHCSLATGRPLRMVPYVCAAPWSSVGRAPPRMPRE